MSDERTTPEAEELGLGEIEEGDDHQDPGAEDAGADDAAEGAEGLEGEEGEGDAPPVGRRGRASETIRQLRQRAQEAEQALRAHRDETDRRFRDLETRRQPDPAAAAAEERARLEVMTADEKAEYFYEKGRREFGGALASIQFQTQDTIDRQSFDAAARNSANRTRLSGKVEQVLTSERQQGRNPSREVIYKYLLGEEVDTKAAKVTPQQRAQAGRRIAAQTTRPGGGRGDVAAGRRPGDDSYEAAMARVAGKPIF